MGLYLGSTRIPTISLYKSGAIVPSGIFNIPSEPTISTRCRVTLTTLESYREYFKYNGTTYRNEGSFEFTAGDTLSIEVYGEFGGADIYEDGQKIGTCDVSQPYSYILPSHELTINTVTSGGGATVYINSVLTSTYDVTNYAFAQGDFGYGRLAERISGDLSYYENLSATQIAQYAFAGTVLSSISMPNVTTIGSGAFFGCSISSVNFPQCISIYSSAFQQCQNLTYVSFPKCTSVDWYVFSSCNFLPSLNLSSCNYMGGYACYNCNNLTAVSLPILSIVNTCTFMYCSSLTNIYLPSVSSVGAQGFYYCTSLVSVNLPICEKLEYYAFNGCNKLVSISVPLCKSVGSYAFQYCYNLPEINLSLCSYIGGQAFEKCYNLLSIYLTSASLVSLVNANAFSSTPIAGYTTSTGGTYGSIYVPSSLLTSYKTATNWATYSGRMVGV